MRTLLLLVIIFAVAGSTALFATGGALAEPRSQAVKGPPKDLPLIALRIPRADSGSIAAWFASGNARQGGILLVHGVRSDRRQMLDRARFLFAAGYSVLLIDLQAHGETPGKQINFGSRESLGVDAAVASLNARLSGRPIGVIGASLGDAAARLGVHPDELASIATIRRLDAPVMIIAGNEDRRTQLGESKALYLRAKSPKRLWLINGAQVDDGLVTLRYAMRLRKRALKLRLLRAGAGRDWSIRDYRATCLGIHETGSIGVNA